MCFLPTLPITNQKSNEYQKEKQTGETILGKVFLTLLLIQKWEHSGNI
jgi:hypothetical protein